MLTKTKGAIAELAVARWLMENGCKVLLPYDENNRYDLVAEKDGKFARIQVKYVTPRNGCLIIRCVSSNNWNVLSYTASEIDAIAVFDSVNEDIYYIPSNKINKTTINLRIKPAKNNQKMYINETKEFQKLCM